VRYLLDTCVISDFVRGDRSTLTKLKQYSPLQIGISSITLMEVNYGLKLNPTKARKLQPILDELFASISILPVGKEEAEIAAQIRAQLKQAGTLIGAYDLLIGATALSHNLILITANIKEFERIEDLSIDSWRT
jgi:tRNA(fMet)-specific endonuclease VapC